MRDLFSFPSVPPPPLDAGFTYGGTTVWAYGVDARRGQKRTDGRDENEEGRKGRRIMKIREEEGPWSALRVISRPLNAVPVFAEFLGQTSMTSSSLR